MGSRGRYTVGIAGIVALVGCHSDRLVGGASGIGGAPPPEPSTISFPLTDVIVYTSTRYDSLGDLFQLDLKTLEKRRLKSSGGSPSCPAIAPDGTAIAYVTSAGLTITTATSSKTVDAGGCPVWSPDGRRLASHRHPAANTETLVVYSREGVLVAEQSPSYLVLPHAWSPDGKDLLYVSCPTTSFPDCYSSLNIVNADTLNNPRLVASPAGPGSFSADGSEIAYQCAGICVVPTKGGASRQIANGTNPEWSPLEARIAFICAPSICISDDNGGSLQTLPGTTQSSFHWAPDGKSILFLKGQRNNDLFVVSVDGASVVNLTRDRGRDDWGWWGPSASSAEALSAPPISLPATSKSLAATDIVYQGVSSDHPRLWLIGEDGTQNRLLFNAELAEQCASLSPDRRLIAFSSLGLWVAAVDGSGEVQIDDRVDATYLQGPDTCPVWSPDGQKLAWGHRFENLTAELRVADVETRQVVRLDSTVRVWAPQWAPDARTIYYVRDVPNPQPGDYDRLWRVSINGTPVPVGASDWTDASVAVDGRLAVQCGVMICVSGPAGENAIALGPGRSPIWSPDAMTIAFVRNFSVFLMKPDGSGVRELATAGAEPHWLSWSPQRDAVVAEVDKNLFVVSTIGRPASLLPFAQLPSWTAGRVF